MGNKEREPTTPKRGIRPITGRRSRKSDAKVPPSLTEGRVAYKVVEVAALLGVDRSSVYDLVRIGKIRAVRMSGGTLLIPRIAIDEYLGGDVA